MKKLIQWGNSLSWMQTAGWSIAFIGTGISAFIYAPIGALLFAWLMWLMWRASGGSKGPITLVLILGMVLMTAKPSQAVVQQECNIVIIGGVVLIVGAIVCYKLIQFCRKVFPDNNQGSKNSPPPNPPGSTNNVPTNSPSVLMSLQTGQPTAPYLNLPTVTPSYEGSLVAYDISTNKWADKTGAIYQDFIWTVVQSSTDLQSWSPYLVVGTWMSSNSMVSVTYATNGTPVSTNWSYGNPYSQAMTNQIPFDLVNKKEPQRFFR